MKQERLMLNQSAAAAMPPNVLSTTTSVNRRPTKDPADVAKLQVTAR